MTSPGTVERHDDTRRIRSRVLVVGGADGDEPAPSAVERALVGATLVAESDPTDALGRLAAEGDIDCVVASQSLPEGDGIEFLRAVRERFPDLPFVLVVPAEEETVVEAALSAGATDVVALGTVDDSLLSRRMRNAIACGDGGTSAGTGTRTGTEALASFGEYALEATDVGDLCEEAIRVVADALDADYVAVLELANDDAFTVRSAVGWSEGLDGTGPVAANPGTLGGRALASGGPIVATDAEHGEWLGEPTVQPEHAVDNGLSVPVSRGDEPWGVLEAYTAGEGPLSGDDVDVVRGVAATLSAALDRERLASAHRRTLERAPVGYFELDAEWCFTDVNDRAVELLGREQRDVLGESLFEAFPDALESWFHDEYRTALDTGGPATFETYYPPAESWFEVSAYPSESGLAVFFTDITDRTVQAGQRRLYELVVDTMEDGLCALDADMRFAMVNDEYVAMTGYSREELVGMHVSQVVDEGSLAAVGTLRQELLAGDRRVVRTDLELACADGTRLPVEARFAAVSPDADAFAGSIGVVRDVSERTHDERTLAALRDAAGRLLRTGTDVEVCEQVERAATDALEFDEAVVYRFGGEETVLRPATAPGSFAGRSNAVSAVGPDDGSPVWEAFAEAEPVAWADPNGECPDADRRGTRRSWLFVPLDGHGVLGVASTGEGAVDERTRQLTELLAGTAEAALDRVTLEADVRELEGRLDRVDRIDWAVETLLGVERALTRSGTREELQRAVCESLVGTERVGFAWIGSVDGAGERLEPREWAGRDGGYVEAVPLALDDDGTEPAVRAATSGEPVVVQDASGVEPHGWRRELLDRGYRSVLSVPLVHDDALYGVLTVCSSDPGAFDDLSTRVFEGVADVTAYGLDALERRRALLSDSVVELDVRIPGSNDVLSRTARHVDGRVTFEGVVPHADASSTIYLSVVDAPAESVLTFLGGSAAVDSVSRVADVDDGGLFIVTVSEPTLVSHITGAGAAIRTLTATGSETTLGLELPQPADVRGFLERLRTEYPGAELVARRSQDRPLRTRQTFSAELEERLTDRQLEVLRTAYLNEYFEWPRGNTGEEIADLLGITQPTFNNHLRVAERKLLTMLLGERKGAQRE
ncbi:GAF domain-containing protein (plasmid) [Halorarum halophilum]|uniref:GAF domain-containing protein n=1 Tax=Halorarum halophilum TaxID=2743090 RepID=A0A7D5KGE3_9EURY|nr:GAF domain-containing protein [Halobaculum halophilum]QLG29737.1 GAF domain-containing protein [Halobaculum halophilum]